jgi:sigma-B regulation protein RsbU (phosphoserine phosphatase)
MLKSPGLIRFLLPQAVYLSLALILAGFFWAIGLPVRTATLVVYAFCLGNLVMPPLTRMHPVYSRRSFPYNWLVFVAALIILTPFGYAIASIVVWRIAPPTPQSLGHLIRTGWRLPFLVIILCAVISALFTATKERLERRNLELRRSMDISSAQLAQQERELERAREIQESLLPKQIPQLRGFEIATAWQPARMVGGDYFDVVKLDENRLAICIADVVGKGVSAALLMANVQATVRAFGRDSESPALVCSRVNSVLCETIAIGKFVTFFYGVLDADKHSLQYCDAGHPLPILVSGDSCQQLRSGGAVLGVFPAWKYEDSVVTLHPEDRLVLFTDGITEASASDGEEFGEAKLATLVKANHAASAAELTNRVLAHVNDFCGGQFQDDATLLVIAVK